MMKKLLITGLAAGMIALTTAPAMAGNFRHTPISVAPVTGIDTLPSVQRVEDIVRLQPGIQTIQATQTTESTQPRLHLRGLGDLRQPVLVDRSTPRVDEGEGLSGLSRIEIDATGNRYSSQYGLSPKFDSGLSLKPRADYTSDTEQPPLRYDLGYDYRVTPSLELQGRYQPSTRSGEPQVSVDEPLQLLGPRVFTGPQPRF